MQQTIQIHKNIQSSFMKLYREIHPQVHQKHVTNSTRKIQSSTKQCHEVYQKYHLLIRQFRW